MQMFFTKKSTVMNLQKLGISHFSNLSLKIR